MAYCSSSAVGALCQSIMSGASDFGASTSPILAAVNSWLSSGCAVLEAKLGEKGYSAPGSTSVGYAWLADLNAFYAAARVEMSRSSFSLEPGARTRGQVFEEMFWAGLERLGKMDLSMVGFARDSAGKLYAGGISQDDKDTYEEDSDRVKPRFTRNQFGFPDTIRPDSLTAAS